jgi:hypothetical protein
MRRILALFTVVATMAVMMASPAFAVGSIGSSGAGNDYVAGTNGSKIGGGSEAAGHKGRQGGNPGADAGTHGGQAGGGVEF